MTQEIEIFNITDEIGKLMTNNLIDIRTDRTNSRWIFPTFPDSDDNYPEVIIEIENLVPKTTSGGNYFKEEQIGATYKLYSYKEVEADLTFYVLTSKKFNCNVTIEDENRHLSNKLPNIFITNNIKDIILQNRDSFLEFVEDIQIQNITSVYEDNKSAWAAEVKCKITYKDIWVKELLDGQLVQSYSLSTNTI